MDPRKLLGTFASSHIGPEAKAQIKGLINQLNTPQGFAALEQISLLAGPEGPVIATAVKGAVTTAKILYYVAMFYCVISFIIYFSTFVASMTAKDEKKKKSLRGAWIAFLVLMFCMSIIAFILWRGSSLSRIVQSQLKTYGFDLNA